MRWRTASISLMALTLLLIGAAIAQNLLATSVRHAALFSDRVNRSGLQMGYYDLLSKNSELYNPHFEVSDNQVMMKLYNPDDNRLQIKVRMTLKGASPQGLIYDYQPVYLPKKNNVLLISSILGFLQHDSILFKRINSAEGNITVISSGQIISDG